MILSLVQTKGGTGKSTLATCLAFSNFVRKKFKRISLVEFDPQGTLLTWWTKREHSGLPTNQIIFSPVFTIDERIIEKEINELSDISDLIILDVPGESISKYHTQFACIVSDIALIPMRTSTKDEDAFFDNLLPAIDKYRTKSTCRFLVIPSFTHPNIKPKTAINYINHTLNGFDFIQSAGTVFPFRSVYENFDRGGKNLHEYADTLRHNKKRHSQAKLAENDIETIAKQLFKEN